MSIALLAGLLINYLWRISWVDYVATVVILGFIAKEVHESFWEMKGKFFLWGRSSYTFVDIILPEPVSAIFPRRSGRIWWPHFAHFHVLSSGYSC